MVVGRDGKGEVREVMQARWTLDERVIDGFYAGEALRYVQRVMEDPERYLGKAGGRGGGREPGVRKCTRRRPEWQGRPALHRARERPSRLAVTARPATAGSTS